MCNLSTLQLLNVVHLYSILFVYDLTTLDDMIVYVKSDTEQGIILKSRMAVKHKGPVQPVFYYVYIILPDFAN